MDDREARGRQQSEDYQHLCVPDTGASNDSHRRSPSPASTVRTRVELNPDYESEWEGEEKVLKRRQTQVTDVPLSWWDCVKGVFFGLEGVRRRLVANVELAAPEAADIDMFDHNVCPFDITVAVFPCPESAVSKRQEGRCILDTGCLQGNIISLTFANQLGYTEFQPLKPREKGGGTVMNGQVHNVLGAIHISWYHSTSPKVFRDMRFLVSESASVDLLIGTHSIVRHRLISPPNLEVTSYHIQISNPDPREQELMDVVMRCKQEYAKQKCAEKSELDEAEKALASYREEQIRKKKCASKESEKCGEEKRQKKKPQNFLKRVLHKL